MNSTLRELLKDVVTRLKTYMSGNFIQQLSDPSKKIEVFDNANTPKLISANKKIEMGHNTAWVNVSTETLIDENDNDYEHSEIELSARSSYSSHPRMKITANTNDVGGTLELKTGHPAGSASLTLTDTESTLSAFGTTNISSGHAINIVAGGGDLIMKANGTTGPDLVIAYSGTQDLTYCGQHVMRENDCQASSQDLDDIMDENS